MRINGQIVKFNTLGEGGFNKTYLSEDNFKYTINGTTYNNQWILKIPKKDSKDKLSEEMNHSKRAVRLWNQLNPNYPAIELPEQGGWLAPYLGRTPALDLELANKQIEIYRDHRRIIVDACGDHNFLSFNGELICVDVDASVHCDSPTSKKILDEIVLIDDHMSGYESYWQEYSEKEGMTQSVQITKTLLYLDNQMPAAEIKDEYITKKIINQLHQYQINKLPIDENVLQELLFKKATYKNNVTFFALTRETINEVEQYDNSRCVVL